MDTVIELPQVPVLAGDDSPTSGKETALDRCHQRIDRAIAFERPESSRVRLYHAFIEQFRTDPELGQEISRVLR